MSSTMTANRHASSILAARRAIQGAVYRTPLQSSAWLSERTGRHISLKLECWQPTGSFKVRGASAAVAQLSPEERSRGVVTASAGNHGLGLAYAATRAGIDATIVVPDAASPAKVAALERFPIRLVRGGPSYDHAERLAHDLSTETGAVFVSPYNDPWVIAGQGTIGVELLEDAPDLDAVLVPVGGGGLISGIGAWIKAVRPQCRVIGVQSVASPAMHRALEAGRLVEIEVLPTLADGLAANIEAGSLTFDIARDVVDGMILVDEDQIAAAVRDTLREEHIALEGSAAVGIAAILNGLLPADLLPDGLPAGHIALLLTGRNIALDRLIDLLTQ